MALVKACRHKRSHWRKCRCQWYADVRIDGRRRRFPLGPEYDAARKRYAHFEADRLDGKVTAPRSGEDIGSLARRALAEQERYRGLRPRTLEVRRAQLQILDRYWSKIPVAKITTRDVRRFNTDLAVKPLPRTGRPPSPSYARGLRSLLAAALDQALDEGLIETVPWPASRSGRGKEAEKEHLTFEQIGAVIDDLRAYRAPYGPRRDVNYGDLAELVLLTGLRIGELIALRRTAVDLERRQMRVIATAHKGARGDGPPKTRDSRRVVTLSPRSVELLRRYVEHPLADGRIFDTNHDAAGHALKLSLKRLGLDARGRAWHEFRHAHEALLDHSGTSIRASAARMGHGANFAQTASYGWTAEAEDVTSLDETWIHVRTHAG